METAILKRLAADDELRGKIATFNLQPAIFYGKAPADTAQSETLYPHVIFSVDKFSDVQKGVAGILSVDIMSTQLATSPEEIETALRGRLEGVFLKAQDGEVFSLKWQRSDLFNEPASERMPLLIGVTMAFEIYEWRSAETFAPDPIQALNIWAARFEQVIIGVTDFGEIFEPLSDKPAIFFDMQRERLLKQQNVLEWLDATINLHVFAPNVTSRRQWLKFFNQEIMNCGTIFLADGSPMFLQDMEYLYSADEIQGQIQYVFRYGLPRNLPYAPPLNKLHFNSGSVNHVQH